jgi:hypothetical protein
MVQLLRANVAEVIMIAALVAMFTLLLSSCVCAFEKSLGDESILLIGPHAYGVKPIQETSRNEVGNFIWIPKWKYPLGTAVGYASPASGWSIPGGCNYYIHYSKTATMLEFLEEDILASVNEAVKNGLYFMLTGRRGLSDRIQPGGWGIGGDSSTDILTPEIVRKISEIAGEYFIGLHMEEMDIDYIQNGILPKYYTRQGYGSLYKGETRKEARQYFEKHFANLIERYRSWGTRAIPNMSITFYHYAYRAGAEVVVAELLEHLPSVELQMAYLRGAHTQYGKPWGIWVSPWYWSVPTNDPDLWENKNLAKVGGGHTRFSFERSLYLSYYSGASIFTQQETEPIFTDLDKDGFWELGDWGQELKTFYDYTNEYPETGDSTSDVAILVHLNAGWAQGGLWGNWDTRDKGHTVDTAWAKWDAEKPDYMMTYYLEQIFPGFGRAGTTDIHSADQVYPGAFVSTPSGPVDIMMSDASASQMRRYSAILYLGYSEMDSDLLQKLKDYVSSGGVLLLNAAQLRSTDGTIVNAPDFLGLEIEDEIRTAQLVKAVTNSEFYEDGQLFVEKGYKIYETTVGSAQVIAKDERNRPVMVVNEYGSGKVYLTTPDYLVAGTNEKYSAMKFAEPLVSTMVRSHQEVTITPAGDISYIVTRTKLDERIVVLINHGKVQWSGRISFRDLEVGDVDTLKEHMEVSVEIADDGVSAVIAPESVVVLKIGIQLEE